MSLKFNIQFFGGGGGGASQYRKRDPEPEELKNLRLGLYNKIMPGLEAYDADGWQKAQGITDTALEAQKNLLGQLQPTIEKGGGILDEMMNVVRTGDVPTAFTDRMNSAVTKDLQGGMGNMLNSLGNRGVLNSSITNQGVSRLGQQAADAYNRNYLNAFNSVINGYAQGLSGNQANANALIGGMNAAGNMPTAAYEGAAAGLMPAFNLWKAWQGSYDNREDYDTVVTQGK